MSQAELAAKEREVESRLTMGRHGRWLAGAIVLFVLGLVLPHAGDVRGFNVLFFTSQAAEGSVKIAEYIFVLLGALGVVVFGAASVATKKTNFAMASYLITGMALFFSLFGLWMRKQSAELLGASGIGAGFYLEVLATIITVCALTPIVFGRSPEQERVAALRFQAQDLDEVGYAQRNALVSRQMNTAETNPLLIDDRRQQAARRHKKGGGAEG